MMTLHTFIHFYMMTLHPFILGSTRSMFSSLCGLSNRQSRPLLPVQRVIIRESRGEIKCLHFLLFYSHFCYVDKICDILQLWDHDMDECDNVLPELRWISASFLGSFCSFCFWNKITAYSIKAPEKPGYNEISYFVFLTQLNIMWPISINPIRLPNCYKVFKHIPKPNVDHFNKTFKLQTFLLKISPIPVDEVSIHKTKRKIWNTFR